MMTRPFPSLLLAALLAVSAVPQGLAQTAPTAPTAPLRAAPTTAHLDAVSELLDAMRAPDLVMLGLQKNPNLDPQLREFLAHFRARVGRADIVRRLAPVYAQYFSALEAQSLTRALRTPGGRRATQYMLDTEGGTKRNVPVLSGTEKQLVAQFNVSPAANRLAQLQERANKDMLQAMVDWGREYAEQLYMGGLKAIVSERLARAAKQEEPRPFMPAPVGLSYVDAFVQVIAKEAFRSAHAGWQLDHDIAALGANELLTPATLVDPVRIAKGRASIDAMERSVETYVAETATNMAEYRQALNGISMPGKANFVREVEKGIERQFERSVAFAENQRAIIDLMRRIMTFAEAHKGKLQAHEGKLAIDTDSGVAEYNALLEALHTQVAKAVSSRDDNMARLDRILTQ